MTSASSRWALEALHAWENAVASVPGLQANGNLLLEPELAAKVQRRKR
jgi:hypothetical protein